ncbi:MAG: GH3 auxin-responsive promoter family protein, partial [Parasporobacterium sp.]|nr:GH3 auxin-responsive promoter family protein [Parasporobacterium sp.]
VSLMMTANPSSVLELQKTVDENFDAFCDEIETGTLSEDLKLTKEIRKDLMKVIKPNRRRARELRRIKETVADNRPLPMDYWPHLRILSTWKCGNTAFYAGKFKGWFPLYCQHIEVGYFASECRFGMVLRGGDTTVPFPHRYYFEFIAEEDFGKKDPYLYKLHELKTGRRYCPVITTSNGLYRYNMNDMVECGPRYKNTHTIFMVQKINGIVSMTGEKLHEHQFINAVEMTAKSLNQPVQFFMGFANLADSRYDFYVEFINDTTDEEREQFNTELDQNLKNLNVEYESKRDSLRLNDPVIHRLPKNAYETFKERLLAKGRRDGQFKLALLVQNDELHQEIQRLEI